MRKLGRIGALTVGVIIMLVMVVMAVLYRPDVPLASLKPTYLTSQSKFIYANGDSIHTRVRGQGPALFLLHGSFASLHTWSDWEETLSKDYLTISLDFPGHGLTGPSAGKHYSTDHYAKTVLAVADALQIDSFYVAGNSMGGAVAYKLAIRSPRVKKLILIDAAGAPTADSAAIKATKQPWIFGLLANDLAANLLTRLTPRFLFEKVMAGVFADRTKITPAMIDRYYDLMLREGNRVATVERLRTRSIDSRDSLKTIQIPTLIMWGEKDSWIPVAQAQRFAEAIQQSEVKIFPNAGHVPMEEIPQESVQAAINFLNEKPGRYREQ